MTLYGYEGYTVQGIQAGFFLHNWAGFFCHLYDAVTGNVKYRIPGVEDYWEAVTSESYRANRVPMADLPLFQERMYMPQKGETLFFDKACIIPRARCESQWKRTISLAKADVVVIPEPVRLYSNVRAVYVNEDTQSVYIMSYPDQLHAMPVVGDPLRVVFDQHQGTISNEYQTKEEIRQKVDPALDAICIYVGPLVAYNERQQYILNVLDGLYPRIIYENQLLAALGTPEESFDAQFIESMMVMLNSNDKETVHHGMRILSNMDYGHYPSIARYILTETQRNWSAHKPFNNGVKFMLDHLGVNENDWWKPFKSVTPEEFSMAKELFEGIIRHEIESKLKSLQNATNMNIASSINIECTLEFPETESETLAATPVQLEANHEEDPCPECPKPEDLDFSFIHK